MDKSGKINSATFGKSCYPRININAIVQQQNIHVVGACLVAHAVVFKGCNLQPIFSVNTLARFKLDTSCKVFNSAHGALSCVECHSAGDIVVTQTLFKGWKEVKEGRRKN